MAHFAAIDLIRRNCKLEEVYRHAPPECPTRGRAMAQTAFKQPSCGGPEPYA